MTRIVHRRTADVRVLAFRRQPLLVAAAAALATLFLLAATSAGGSDQLRADTGECPGSRLSMIAAVPALRRGDRLWNR